MGALLAFAPFIAFALLDRALGPVPGLAAGAATSVALLLRDRLQGQRELNVLEAGSALMFTGLALLAWTGDEAAWTLWRVRLWVDLGLLAIVLTGIALRRPFTLTHARRRVSAEVAASAAFMSANNRLSAAWALAFAVLSAADALMVWWPATPVSLAVGLTVAALAAAAVFTARVAARGRPAPVSAG